MLIIHGDADELVPIQQAKLMIDKLKAAGVEAELITKPGVGHTLEGMEDGLGKFADWFDKHLASNTEHGQAHSHADHDHDAHEHGAHDAADDSADAHADEASEAHPDEAAK
jgi:acetyl esterase/lipase